MRSEPSRAISFAAFIYAVKMKELAYRDPSRRLKKRLPPDHTTPESSTWAATQIPSKLVVRTLVVAGPPPSANSRT